MCSTLWILHSWNSEYLFNFSLIRIAISERNNSAASLQLRTKDHSNHKTANKCGALYPRVVFRPFSTHVCRHLQHCRATILIINSKENRRKHGWPFTATTKIWEQKIGKFRDDDAKWTFWNTLRQIMANKFQKWEFKLASEWKKMPGIVCWNAC